MMPMIDRNAADDDVTIAASPTTNMSLELFELTNLKKSVIAENACVGRMSSRRTKSSDSYKCKLPSIALTQMRNGKIETVR